MKVFPLKLGCFGCSRFHWIIWYLKSFKTCCFSAGSAVISLLASSKNVIFCVAIVIQAAATHQSLMFLKVRSFIFTLDKSNAPEHQMWTVLSLWNRKLHKKTLVWWICSVVCCAFFLMMQLWLCYQALTEGQSCSCHLWRECWKSLETFGYSNKGCEKRRQIFACIHLLLHHWRINRSA